MRLSLCLLFSLCTSAACGLKTNCKNPILLGFPDNPAWGWDKASPKSSLSNPKELGPDLPPDQSKTAKPFNLNMVQLVHWTPIIPAVLMAKNVYFHSDVWDGIFGDDKERSLLMLLSPIIAFFGGLPGIMMHTYEGWQVAPFKNPLDDPNFRISDFNNQWLRIVAYQFIFVMQYVGLITFALGVLGNDFLGNFQFWSILGFLIGYLGNQHPKIDFSLFQHNTMPLSWYTTVAFGFGVICNLIAFVKLGEYSFPDLEGTERLIKSVLAPLLIAAGGAIEGLLAETRFNQWLHFFAVILFNWGFWKQLDMYNLVAAGGGV